jgi:hypothetical protein
MSESLRAEEWQACSAFEILDAAHGEISPPRAKRARQAPIVALLHLREATLAQQEATDRLRQDSGAQQDATNRLQETTNRLTRWIFRFTVALAGLALLQMGLVGCQSTWPGAACET